MTRTRRFGVAGILAVGLVGVLAAADQPRPTGPVGAWRSVKTFVGRQAVDRVERLKREDPDWKIGYEAEVTALLAAGYDVDPPLVVSEDIEVTEYGPVARRGWRGVLDQIVPVAHAATWTATTSGAISTLTPFEKDGLDTTEANFFSKEYSRNLRGGTNMQFKNTTSPWTNQIPWEWQLTLQFTADQPAIGCPMGFYAGTRCDFRTTSGMEAINRTLGREIFKGGIVGECAKGGTIGAFTGKTFWSVAAGCAGGFAYAAAVQWKNMMWACFNSMKLCSYSGQRCCVRVY